LVRIVCCEGVDEAFEGYYRGKGAIEVSKDLLDKLVRVDQLYLRPSAFIGLQDYVRSQGSRWTALELARVDLVRDFAVDTPFPNLEKLKGHQQTSSVSSIMLAAFLYRRCLFLPPHLKRLDLSVARHTAISVPNAASSSLRFLSISSFTLVDFPDLARLPVLQHLWVQGYTQRRDDVPKVVNAIISCQSLKSLTLDDFWLSWDGEVAALFEGLPASITQLNFATDPPFGEIAVAVNRGFFKSISKLGLRRVFCEGDGDSTEALEGLLDACAREGLEVDYIEGDFAPFGKLAVHFSRETIQSLSLLFELRISADSPLVNFSSTPEL